MKNIEKEIDIRTKKIPQLMSVDELANYLGLQRQTIYNWLHKKKILGIKIGKVWRFDKDEVLTWLREHKTKD